MGALVAHRIANPPRHLQKSFSVKKADLRLLGPSSEQNIGNGPRVSDRGSAADLKAVSLSTVSPTLL
ncbi:hypothetical protein PoB_003473000 [Plakobranchus ocellatus]|uniref:Uncharacterized protein n=1 Tax=Plakobranchus ocellatus TaxID=259542 RepID=A0AAV4ALI6_9GAST|nr:hypothetical protein PoB_003473000 [Plakobranchus ocellatus]